MGWRTLVLLAVTLGAAGALAAAAWWAASGGAAIGTGIRTGGGGESESAPPLPAQRPRVAAMSPGVAATLRDLGAAGLIVGRHGYDAWSDPALPVVGDQAGINAEALLRAAPTHVYVEFGGADQARRLLGPALSGAGAGAGRVTVRDLRLLTLDQIRGSVTTLAQDLSIGADRAAALLAAWDRALEPEPADRARAVGTVLLLHGTDPPAALGPGSFHQQIAQRLGLAPALVEGDAYTVLDSEAVLRLQPGTIVLIQPREPDAARGSGGPGGPGGPGALAGLAQSESGGSGGAAAEPGWRWLSAREAPQRLGTLARLRVPAIEHGRVLLIDLDDGLLPGTGLIRLADALRAAVRLAPEPGR